METARALGAYYTPTRLAEPLARWAIRDPGDTILDPACGEGAFLTAAADRLLDHGADPRRLCDQIAGVDLDARAIARARGALLSRQPGLRWGRLAQGDFFRFAEETLGNASFDAVLGNPPFLRTQGRSLEEKRRELALARRLGTALTAEASSWAAFVATSCGFVKPGGRLAMIVPREAIFVNYTKPLLEMLRIRFADVRLMALGGNWFEGALVKVALLLGEGTGPGTLRLHEARAPGRIEDLIEAAPAARPAPSWVWERIPKDCRAAAAEALAAPALAPLTHRARVSIGVVTGDKEFFLLSRDRVRELCIPPRFLLRALSKPSQLSGARLGTDDLEALDRAGDRGRLLAIPETYAGGCRPLNRYLARGVALGIDRRYKCRTRRPWYGVRRILEPPSAFLGYLVKWRPRLAANAAGVHSTNNLHRIYFDESWAAQAELLAAASYNAVTMLSVELLGRIAAGGVLKIEPGDASKILLPRPEALRAAPRPGERARAIDRALREGREREAYATADRWVGEALAWKARDLARVRLAQLALREVRLRAEA